MAPPPPMKTTRPRPSFSYHNHHHPDRTTVGATRGWGGGGGKVSIRNIALFCLLKALAVCIVGVFYGSFAIHRLLLPNDDGDAYPPSKIGDRLVVPPLPFLSSSSSSSSSTAMIDAAERRPSVAYVVSVTGCGNDALSVKRGYGEMQAMNLVVQGAAVLRHSIHLAHNDGAHSTSSAASTSGGGGSRYDYEMHAMVHPSAIRCSTNLHRLGYIVHVRNTPFDRDDIRDEYYRSVVDGASCCGSKEYIKLYAYTLTRHDVAVILDLDSLILRPLDDLFDALLQSISSSSSTTSSWWSRVPVHRHDDDGGRRDDGNANNDYNATSSSSSVVEALYTRDYNMIGEGNEMYAGVQGGFLMVRPSERSFQEYIELVLEGNYKENHGWGGKYGWAFGGAQIQGICAYYYLMVHPDRGIELDRCKVNAMVDSPRFEKSGRCRDGREKCDDCRDTPLEDVLSAHFTLCGKPWECSARGGLCSGLHSEWFRIRRSFEGSRTDVSDDERNLPDLGAAYHPELYHGYCTGPGGYLPIKV